MTNADQVLLVMGSGDQRFREYLLASAAQRHQLWLFDPDPVSWQAPYVAGSTVLDVFDPDTAVASARELAERKTVLGVYCYHEAVIFAAALVGAALGLPGPSVNAVSAVRDKSRSRELMERATLPQPRSALISSDKQARVAVATIGLPLVCKPCSLGASQGVVKVETEQDLESALAISRSATQWGMRTGPAVLLEEYLTGPEISIDAAVFEGEYMPFFLARKRVGAEPYFEEVGHLVAGNDPLLADEKLMHMLADAHRALGWQHGMTHAEVKLTQHGPVVVEVNGRLGGDLIPYLGQLATGIDPSQVAIDVATGIRPVLKPTRRETVGIRFLYPAVDCRVREATVPRPDDVPGLYKSMVLAGPGTDLRLPPRGYVSRYGYLIARSCDAQQCDTILDVAAELARCHGEPLPH